MKDAPKRTRIIAALIMGAMIHMRHDRHIYANVLSMAVLFVGAITMLSNFRNGDAKGNSPATEPSPPRDARSNEIKVGVFVDKRNFTTGKKPRRAAIIAYVLNDSQTDIQVSLFALTGPIIASAGPREGIPLELRSERPQKTLVTLQPNEMMARSLIVDEPPDESLLSAYYTIYAPGHLGQPNHMSAIVYSDGKITNVADH